MSNMFTNCTALTNESLNSILASLANGTKLSSSNKRLKYIGLTQSQCTLCTTLSNWTQAEADGWTTGY